MITQLIALLCILTKNLVNKVSEANSAKEEVDVTDGDMLIGLDQRWKDTSTRLIWSDDATSTLDDEDVVVKVNMDGSYLTNPWLTYIVEPGGWNNDSFYYDGICHQMAPSINLVC